MGESALVGMLSLLLILAGTLSANHALHLKLHGGNTSAEHLCLLCSLSKGQVSAAEAGPVLATFLVSLCFFLPLLRTVRLPVIDRRLAPSRGPPALLSSRRVVG
jgi:hypothetical protein